MTQVEIENIALKKEIASLKSEIKSLKRLIYGAKKEGFKSDISTQQLGLFAASPNQVANSDESASKAKDNSAPTSKPKPKKSRKGISRNRFPDSIRREVTIIEPDDIEGKTLIGEDVTETLAYQPAVLFVKQIKRPKYADPKNPDEGILQAPIPARTVPKGMVDESLIAQIIVEKIQFHTPVYRFAKKLKQIGIDFIGPNNLNNWFHKGAESLLPIYELMKSQVLKQTYIQADETPILVLTKNKKGATHRGYVWAYHSPEIKTVFFNYNASRGKKAADAILAKYKGDLQVDGYNVYELIAKNKPIQLHYCMAHARRKFFEAKEIAPEIAHHFLEQVQQLYQIERQAREQNLGHKQRQKLREELAAPILVKLAQWLKEKQQDPSILPSTPIRKAIDYAYTRWKGLSSYVHNGKIEIDNNLIENTIRPIALGRKNYMFAGSHNAAQNLAVLYSIVGTCEKNNINPFKYLKWLLKKVATNKVNDQAIEWLPHRIDPTIIEK